MRPLRRQRCTVHKALSSANCEDVPGKGGTLKGILCVISYAAELLEGIGILELTAGRPVLTSTGPEIAGKTRLPEEVCVCQLSVKAGRINIVGAGWPTVGESQGGFPRDQVVVRRKKGGQPIDDLGQANWQDWSRKASLESRAMCKEVVDFVFPCGGPRKQELTIFFSSKAREFECLSKLAV